MTFSRIGLNARDFGDGSMIISAISRFYIAPPHWCVFNFRGHKIKQIDDMG